MSDTIWYTCTTYLSDHQHLPFLRDPDFVDGEKLQSVDNRNWAGESLPRDAFPAKLVEPHEEDPEYRVVMKQRFAALPDLFDSAMVVVSKRVVDVLSRFDMGQGHFYPMPLISEHGDPFPGEHFAWNFGNTKPTLLPEQSASLQENRLRSGTLYRPPMPGIEGHVAVSESALAGPDAWVEWRMRQTLFVTGGVFDALSEAGLAETFRFTEAQVIG